MIQEKWIAPTKVKGNDRKWLALVIVLLIGFAVFGRGNKSAVQEPIVEAPEIEKIVAPVASVAPVVPVAVMPDRYKEDPKPVAPVESPKPVFQNHIVNSGNTTTTINVYNNHSHAAPVEPVTISVTPSNVRTKAANVDCDSRLEQHKRTVEAWNARFFSN